MDEVLLFRASRVKAGSVAACALAGVAAGLWMSAERPLAGACIAVFFTLCMAAALFPLRGERAFLKLDRAGFELMGTTGRQRIGWSEVRGFRVGRAGGARGVLIEFREESDDLRAARGLAAALTGAQGLVPDLYSAPPEAVCDALERWRARHERGEGALAVGLRTPGARRSRLENAGSPAPD